MTGPPRSWMANPGTPFELRSDTNLTSNVEFSLASEGHV